MMQIKFSHHQGLFLRDPEESALGRKIIARGIELIHKHGFEEFNFKKLASDISSTEASIYRYFENKHQLLLYLMASYWSYLAYLIEIKTNNIKSTRQKIKISLRIICNSKELLSIKVPFDIEKLSVITMCESTKSFLIKNVDEINKEGVFREFKTLSKLLADLFHDYNPKAKFTKALASTVLEIAYHQSYFALHLPSLTELKPEKNGAVNSTVFIEQLVFNFLDFKND